MKVFAVCTHTEGWYNALAISAQRGGYNLITIGWQQTWGGFVWRMSLILDALETLNEDEIICFVDAYDVIILVPAIELRARYTALVHDGRVLLAVENPLKEPLAYTLKRAVFGACVGGQTVNAGAYMGTVAMVRKFIVLILNRAQETSQPNDQKVLNSLCRTLVKDELIAVDTEGDVFFHAVCASNRVSGVVHGYCLFGLGANLENPLTGRRPAMLHAPGGLSLDRVCRRLDLPEGHVRKRMTWIVQNYKIESVIFGGVLFIIVVVIICTLCNMKRA